jgi:hypothetical protein
MSEGTDACRVNCDWEISTANAFLECIVHSDNEFRKITNNETTFFPVFSLKH